MSRHGRMIHRGQVANRGEGSRTMAKIEFETPALKDWLSTPAVQRDSMAHSKPFVAKPAHQEPLGFPGELVDNWQDVALEKMGDLLGRYRSLQVFMDSGVKCGACTETCPSYLGKGDEKNMAGARTELSGTV